MHQIFEIFQIQSESNLNGWFWPLSLRDVLYFTSAWNISVMIISISEL